MSVILEYLNGRGIDHKGRKLDEVLKQNDVYLEENHDYIQWLFPLKEPSYNVPEAPVITEEEITLARSSEVIKVNMENSLDRMTKFYLNNDQWLEPREHNHLRITRIIKSSRMILGDEPAEEFYNQIMECVKKNGVEILTLHMAYWTDAMGLAFDKPPEIIRAF